MGCFLLMLGLFVTSAGRGPSFTALNALGEEIGRGIAHAACIEAGGEWRINQCNSEGQ